ncbi:MAG: RNA polymerase sigma factor [Planctomycetota bacterium]|nr:RNA polymerase sigma factor [Planctomycetota bacterium]
METTRPSLLLRIRDPADRDSWSAFHGLYRPILLRYALARGLGHEDAEDVSQHALSTVHASIEAFDYDPARGRFHGWLRTIVNNRVRNLLRDRATEQVHREHLAQERPEADPAPSPDQVFEDLWMQEHLWHCLREIQLEVNARTYAIFERLVIEEVPVARICEEFGVDRGGVYTIKWRVTKRIAERMRQLTEEGR